MDCGGEVKNRIIWDIGGLKIIMIKGGYHLSLTIEEKW